MFKLIFSRNLEDKIEELKKLGEVTETETEKNGFSTKTIEFVSKDGTTKIKQSSTQKIKNGKELQLQSLWKEYFVLQASKEESVIKENYTEAAKIKEKQEDISNQIKQINNEIN